MRNILSTLFAVLLLTGCASFHEAYYVDREFGDANRFSWDQQVAYPDAPHADTTPETLEGITAEAIMDIHQGTFEEEPEDINILQFGIRE